MSTTIPIYIIYKHTCTITGKYYIGQTSQGILYRWKQHLWDCKRRSNYHFHNAILKHGEKNWIHEILFETTNQSIINEKEIEYIAMYNSNKRDIGYNMTIGGEGFGTGENNPRFGTHHSDNTKKILSVLKLGENHPKFKGWYHVPWGRFPSALQAKSLLLKDHKTIINWCKNYPDKIITIHSVKQSPYLKSLKESPIGKTFREIGFYFESM